MNFNLLKASLVENYKQESLRLAKILSDNENWLSMLMSLSQDSIINVEVIVLWENMPYKFSWKFFEIWVIYNNLLSYFENKSFPWIDIFNISFENWITVSLSKKEIELISCWSDYSYLLTWFNELIEQAFHESSFQLTWDFYLIYFLIRNEFKRINPLNIESVRKNLENLQKKLVSNIAIKYSIIIEIVSKDWLSKYSQGHIVSLKWLHNARKYTTSRFLDKYKISDIWSINFYVKLRDWITYMLNDEVMSKLKI